MGQCTGELVVLDVHGQVEPDIDIVFRAAIIPNIDIGSGSAFDSTQFTATSDGNGVISALFPSGEVWYEGQRGDGAWVQFPTASDDGDTFTLPYILGTP